MIPKLQSTAPPAAIAELCATLQKDGRLNDSAAFYDAVMTRELLSATSISPGWALPHARLKGLSQLSFALGRTFQPLVWFGESKSRVQTIFLFAVPETEAKTYLNLIAAVARLSQNAALLEQLQRARDEQGMFEILQQAPLRQPRPAATANENPTPRALGAAVN